jgi:hypothetical protein
MEIPEYGRNVQKLVDFAVTVKDRDERNKVAQAIINIMGVLNPHLRDAEEYTHKLWAHLFVMSKFQLDVDSPYPIPTPETLQEKPDIMPYPKNKIRYGHYGNTTQLLINKAIEFPDGDEKDALIRVIANIMKKDYVAFNNRGAVENEVIQHQMDTLSGGKLKIKDLDSLMTVNEVYRVMGNPNTSKKKTNYKKNNSNKRKKK